MDEEFVAHLYSCEIEILADLKGSPFSVGVLQRRLAGVTVECDDGCGLLGRCSHKSAGPGALW
jgi:hypothetical protein